MAEQFQANTFDLNSINGGEKFIDDDGFSPDVANKIVEAAAYAQQAHKIYEHYYSGTLKFGDKLVAERGFAISFLSKQSTYFDESTIIDYVLTQIGGKMAHGFVNDYIVNVTLLTVGTDAQTSAKYLTINGSTQDGQLLSITANLNLTFAGGVVREVQ